MRALLSALAVVYVASAPALHGEPAESMVRLDTIAFDSRGTAVADLAADDFELIEDGVPRAIDQVRFVRADGRVPAGETFGPIESRADEEQAASGDAIRLFAIYLDEYHLRSGEALERARAALSRFVEQDLGPRDLVVAVRPLESLASIRMTRDHQSILQDIASFQPRLGDYTPRSSFEQNYIAGSPERIEAQRVQVALSALSALTAHLGSLAPSRKSVIFLSEGFSRPERRRGDEALPGLDTVIRAANRLNVSIYALDPRAFDGGAAASSPATSEGAAAAADAGRETLRALAARTGGRGLFDRADVASGLTRIATDSSGYYLLFLKPPPEAPFGSERFHAVELRARRPGVELRTRQGYWTPTAESLRATVTSMLEMAVPARVQPWTTHVSPFIRPWFGQSRGADGRTQVSVVWEPAASVPGVRSRTGPAARVILKAIQTDGTPVFDGTLSQTGTVTADGERTAVFELPPGRLRLQMSIEDAESKVLDTDFREISVNALAGPLVFGTPRVLRARTAREFRTLAADPDAPPAASREFSRSERLLVRVPIYAESGQPTLSARLASALGGPMRELNVTVESAGMRQVEIPLAGLAGGDYRLELVAREGRDEVAENVTFRVTP